MSSSGIVNAQLMSIAENAVGVFVALVFAYTFARAWYPIRQSPVFMEATLLRAYAGLGRVALGALVAALRGTGATFAIAAAVTLAVMLATYSEPRAALLSVPKAAEAALNLYMSVWKIAALAYSAWIVGWQIRDRELAARATAAYVVGSVPRDALKGNVE